MRGKGPKCIKLHQKTLNNGTFGAFFILAWCFYCDFTAWQPQFSFTFIIWKRPARISNHGFKMTVSKKKKKSLFNVKIHWWFYFWANYYCKGTAILLDPTGTHTWTIILQTTWKLSVSVRSELTPLWDIHSDDWQANCAAFYIIARTRPVLLCNEARMFYHSLSFSISLILDLPVALSWLGRQAEWHWSWKKRGVRGCHSLSRPPGHQSHYSQRAEHFDAHCLYRWHKLKRTARMLCINSATPGVQSNPRLNLFRETSHHSYDQSLGSVRFERHL